MAELLFEIFCEEIPARMQVRAGQDLVRLMDGALKEAGLNPQGSEAQTGPRRLTYVTQVETRSPDVSEERKGPRVGAPDRALEGFMRGAGLSDISEAETRSDKKGDFYVAVIKREGQDTAAILKDAIPSVMDQFPWPKSMKSGNSDFRWVRPLRGLTILLDGCSLDGISVGGVVSDNQIFGHRQMGPGPFSVKTHAEYEDALNGDGHVMTDRAARKAKILDAANAVCEAAGCTLVEDEALLDEVAGLVEWPVALLGDMDPAFLSLPEEVIRLTLKSHQKTFTVRGPDGKLAPHFVIIANLETPDGGATIKAGNAKVISARLSDAKFFQDQDRQKKLQDYYEPLDQVVFHKKLGSIQDKAERVAALAKEIAPHVGANPVITEKAARLAKCDLVTQSVIEFTSLQGKIGRWMYEAEGGHPDIAVAIEEHYKPQGPSDAVPTNPVAAAVALADKIDTLVGFWAIDEKPTGSKDPYALRRAALGVSRIILENDIVIGLNSFFDFGLEPGKESIRVRLGLLAFLLDRLKVYLRDQGHKHDVIDAVIAQGGDDLLAISQRVEALGAFLSNADGENLVQGYKRAANILRAEEKKGELSLSDFDAISGLTSTEGQALQSALTQTRPAIAKALEGSDYPAALGALADLREPIDTFFENVVVNADEAEVRQQRLSLLSAIVETFHQIADFSRLDG
jgi:glycyl-tRNA synthetase beta chain